MVGFLHQSPILILIIRSCKDNAELSTSQLILEVIKQLRSWKKASSVKNICARMALYGRNEEESTAMISSMLIEEELSQVV